MADSEEIVVRYQFDRDAVWERVKGRKTLYLDMNVWIDMADGKKPEAQPVKERLRERVRAGRLVCPLIPSLVWELDRQTYTRLRTGSLMEELSLNVCFVRLREVFDWEVERLAKRLAGREDGTDLRKMLFVPAVGYVASGGSLHYPAGSPADYVRDSAKLIFDRIESLSLTDLLTLRGEESAEYFRRMAPVPFQEQARWFQQVVGDRDKVWRIEEESVLERYIRPAIDKLDAALLPGLLRFVKEAPRDKYGGCLPTLLAELPAVHNHVEVMARNSVDPGRKDRVGDFFDLDMMPVPLSYADAFMTQDGWVRERFIRPGGFLKRSRCVFCSSYAELGAWLDSN